MSRSTILDITKMGVGAGLSGDSSPLPPISLLRASIYQQPPGSHPGGKKGEENPVRRFSRVTSGIELVELVISGRGWVKVDGELQEVTPGALLWHVEGDESICRSDWDNPYCCLAVPFETHPYAGTRRTAHLAWWREIEEVQKFSAEVVASYLDDQFDRSLICLYAYSRLLFQSRLCWQHGGNSTLPTKLRRAVELINEHYTDSLSLSEIASRVGWSLPHLHEVFRNEIGVTPHQFILERRIKVAKDQLAITEHSVKMIALECGFSNPAAFCHAFKIRTGMTPLNYRKQERGRLHS